MLSPTETCTGTLIDQDGHPIAGAYVSGICGHRRYGFAETNGRGEFTLQLPKKVKMDRYDVGIPGRHLGNAKPTIIKHEPLTLQFDNVVILLDLGKEKVRSLERKLPRQAPANGSAALSFVALRWPVYRYLSGLICPRLSVQIQCENTLAGKPPMPPGRAIFG